tara:strand:+ start:10135 stop:10434 length:300 start_codon:yes stop_codon:yes gene_type:complete
MGKAELKYTGFDGNFPRLKNGQYYTYIEIVKLTSLTHNQVRKRLANKKQFSGFDLKHSVSKWHKERNKTVDTVFIDGEDGSAKSKKLSQEWLRKGKFYG